MPRKTVVKVRQSPGVKTPASRGNGRLKSLPFDAPVRKIPRRVATPMGGGIGGSRPRNPLEPRAGGPISRRYRPGPPDRSRYDRGSRRRRPDWTNADTMPPGRQNGR